MIKRLLFAAMAVFSIACATVTPGNVVMEVPVCGGDAGHISVLHQGRYWPATAYCTNYYTIPSRELNVVWAQTPDEGNPIDESITFAGKDGQKVNVDVSVGYTIANTDEGIIQMTKVYGYDVANIIHTRVRNSARNAMNMCASHMSVDQIYGEGKSELFKCAEKMVQDEYAANGLHITRMTLNSEVRLPQQVQAAMEASTAATQDAQRVDREVQSSINEGRKRVAAAEADASALKAKSEADAAATIARAEGEARANRELAASITPELLRLKALDIERVKAEKWSGNLPTITSDGGSGMFIDLRTAGALK